MSILWGNASATRTNGSLSPADIPPTNLVLATFILVSFLVGISINGLFLWILGVKMKRTVNTLWFLHLILIYFTSCLVLLFFAINHFLNSHWVFGTILCKVINSLASLGMFTSVFLLTIISLDRYLLIRHPIWSQHNRTVSRARWVIAGAWLTSLTLTAPYLAFTETRVLENGRIDCLNNYAFSSDWDGPRMDALRDHVHLALFVVQFLLGFLVPFCIIMGCYCGMGWEMKKKGFTKNRKPFKVLVVAVASFFICWLPYHLYFALFLLPGMPEVVLRVLYIFGAIGVCFNICCTPVLYLFVGEKFQQVFKMSLLALFNKSFVNVFFVSEEDVNTGVTPDPCQ
ncbi:PREDICTED: probable G-protein coupled receptor 33 [Gekko japonicus]|uniref:Probable G-protein coupled receptor 33 n=1 Tax=Gekko japonicus TaxID=146911 RepID=A0ABM1LBJ1_GEKJA|nr:PREDICTED: probable G-protein coupled receptor 33 [Gekko japonicus]